MPLSVSVYKELNRQWQYVDGPKKKIYTQISFALLVDVRDEFALFFRSHPTISDQFLAD